MEACQTIPSILSCFWPASHPEDTAAVHVLWLSNPPPNLPISVIPQNLMIWNWIEGYKKYFHNFSFTMLFNKACDPMFVIARGFAQLIRTNKTNKKKWRIWTPTPVFHVIALFPQSCHVLPSSAHSCNELEIGITLLSGSNPWGVFSTIFTAPSAKHEGDSNVFHYCHWMWHGLMLKL